MNCLFCNNDKTELTYITNSQVSCRDCMKKISDLYTYKYSGNCDGSVIDRLTRFINQNSLENGSNTPDFVLAVLLSNTLDSFATAMQERDRWFGFRPMAALDAKKQGESPRESGVYTDNPDAILPEPTPRRERDTLVPLSMVKELVQQILEERGFRNADLASSAIRDAQASVGNIITPQQIMPTI